MIKQTIEFTSDTGDLRIQRKTTRELKQWQIRTLQRFRQEPGRPRYPIRWTSERQRRFVMAKLTRENNLPYRRTGALVKAWDVNVDYQQVSRWEAFQINLLRFLAEFGVGTRPQAPAAGVIVEVTNDSPIEQYVTGIHQQGFHQDTGWYKSKTVLDTVTAEVEGILSDL